MPRFTVHRSREAISSIKTRMSFKNLLDNRTNAKKKRKRTTIAHYDVNKVVDFLPISVISGLYTLSLGSSHIFVQMLEFL
jgi:hypothetical protein